MLLILLLQNDPALVTSHEPRRFKSVSKRHEWLPDMHKEMEALRAKQTWDIIPRPPNTNIVGSKWIFLTKYHSYRSIERHKACLVAQEFTQLQKVDFSHIFSPVVKAATNHIILALVVSNNWNFHQLDVKNDFLNGFLTNPVYMEQPSGFIDP